jgi:hypothetical protein
MIPIRAVGLRPFLTIPDEINFGSCPMKTPTRKAILVQNTGNSTAQFTIKSNSKAFSCTNDEIIVHPGSSLMIDFFFNPKVSTVSYGEFELCYNNGVKCYIQAVGVGSNVDVALSSNSVALESCYISLSTEKTIKIKNMSNVPITYSWKSCGKEYEDDYERERLLQELNDMEEAEMKSLLSRSNIDSFAEDEDESSVEGTRKSADFEAQAESAALVRKYRNLRQNLLNDHMLFADNIFEITPAEGSIWANSDTEVTITFRPDAAAVFNCTAYLDITGRQDRLSLQMTGHGIGPHAVLSFDILDVGDVYVNEERYFEMHIINKGDIPAHWSYLNSVTNFGRNFDFSPREGEILPGKSQLVTIRFESNILGEFVEFFRFMLQGNEDLLVCQIKGHVIGPTFHFDVTTIDFGEVSYDYLHSTILRMVNTSTIMMAYTLHIPQDGQGLHKEFNIEPSEGVLQAGQQTDILIEFIPLTVKNYDYSLAVDVLGVGDMLVSVPIIARCNVASVRVDRNLDFGECFIRYPYTRELVLYNTSDRVHTKYIFLPQSEESKFLGSYEVEPSTGVIEPNDRMVLTVRLLSLKLAVNSIPYKISIAGSNQRPVEGQFLFNGVGPKVKSSIMELRYGCLDCLKDYTKSFTLSNSSSITAAIKMFLKMGRSKFRLSVHELVLEPYEDFVVEIIANLDDSVPCKDELHIIVEEGDNLMIPLSAIGSGSTMHCAQDLNVIDLGIQLTNTNFEKSFVLENKGRRQQYLRWTNVSVITENKKRAAQVKKMNKEVFARLPKHLAPLVANFTIQPEEITLRPRTATTFTIRGNISAVGSYQETFRLESRIGKERLLKTISESLVKCAIITPLLEFSTSSIDFNYVWERGSDVGIQRYQLHLKNSSAIPLIFQMKTEIPFNLSAWEHTLAPQESTVVIVEFDPLYRDDKTSHGVSKTIVFAYKGHSQRDTIAVKANISFPNLSFDRTSILFGSLMNDTSKVIRMNITNNSSLTAAYDWQLSDSNVHVNLVENIGGNVSSNSSTANSTSLQVARRRPPANIPLDSIVDILPTRAILAPGESQYVEFTYYGKSNTKFSCTAQCLVEGGPTYRFVVSGEASFVSYSLLTSVIDFGKVLFSDRAIQEFTIQNTGKVAIDFKFNHTSERGEDLIRISPSNGRIESGADFKVKISIRPMLPTTITEKLELHIAHFDMILIDVLCEGIFTAPILNLPRYMVKLDPYGKAIKRGEEKEVWDKFNAEVKDSLWKTAAMMNTMKLTLSRENFQLSATSTIPPLYPGNDMDEDSLEGEIEETDVSLVSLLSPTSGPRSKSTGTQHSREIEMQRKVLYEKLNERYEIIPMQTSGAPTASSVPFRNHVDVETITIATYHLDFGNIIYGQTRKRYFRVTNNALTGSLSWSFDKKVVLGTGFSFEPDSISKLTEGGWVDICVKYFAKQAQPTGLKTLTVPLTIKGCPRVDVVCTANVCQPELEISSDILHFDSVSLGQSKTMFFLFTNNTLVNCSWSTRKVGGKDDSRFSLSKMEGMIRPGKREVISVEFLPLDSRLYRSEIQLKVEHNSKPRTIVFDGYGQGYALRFDPPSLSLGPILPFAAAAEQVVSITNNSSVPIEVYAVDYDDVVVKEEEILVKLSSHYDNAGIIRTSLRKPGDGLPTEIYEILHNEDQHVSVGEVNGELSVESSIVSDFSLPPKRIRSAPRDSDMHQDIIVLGPPAIGISSTASAISKQLGYSRKTLSQLLAEACKTKGDEGYFARRLLCRLTESEKSTLALKEQELRTAADSSQTAAIELYKKQAKKKVKDVPPEVLRTDAVIAFETFVASGTMNQENLARVLNYRLGFDDAGYGIILDGIRMEEPTISETIILAALKLAMKHPLIVCLSADCIESYQERIRFLLDSKHDQLLTLEENVAKHRANLERLRNRMKKLDDSVAMEPMPMTGDESWCAGLNDDQFIVAELDDSELRQMEDPMRIKYHLQAVYMKSAALSSCQEELQRLEYCQEVTNSSFEDYQTLLSQLPDEDQSLPKDNLQGGMIPITVNTQDNVDTICSSIIAVLPPPTVPPPSKDALPEPIYQQIIRRPLSRQLQAPSSCFKLTSGDSATSYRWVIPAQGSIDIRIQFTAITECQLSSSLHFEVCGSMQMYSLSCTGICDLPKLHSDPRSIFMKRQRAPLSQSTIPPSKKYLIQDQLYSFGPLSIYKQPQWKSSDDPALQLLTSTNNDTIRFTNAGKLKCIVNFVFDENVADETNRSIFMVEPTTIELDENEAKEVKIWAFPSALKSYSTRLLACIVNNPIPLTYTLTCEGVKPMVTFSGDWDESIAKAEELLASKTIKDKKLLKEQEQKLANMKALPPVDFGRVLLGKIESKKIGMQNQSFIPVAYEIVCDDPLVSFNPSSGLLQPLSSGEVKISFYSTTSTLLNSQFTIRYSDSEGGLKNDTIDAQRGGIQKFSLYGEAYFIKAVSFTADGREGGDEIDFGLLRVGDIASQKIKLGNKGKYRIGYRLAIGSKVNTMLTIQPAEGFIEPGLNNAAEIIFSMCCVDKEINMKSVKDIHVVIFEPETNEVVEHFSLLLSAQVRYSQYRLQPLKGLQFGAIRFDAGAVSKTIELRNEGSFPFTFVICPSLAEHEEIDVLDQGAYSAYAFAMPPGLRKLELGDNYMSKVGARNTSSAAAKKKIASPKPGTSYFQHNASVYDPDSLSPVTLPTDPLQIGAFVITPRIGTLEPGQRLTVDVKFNPKVCDVMKERLRFFISGINPNDSNSMVIKSFDLSGESCIPAIVTNDPIHIFEEQEVVASLADINPRKVAYAEADRVLSFGAVMCEAMKGNAEPSTDGMVFERIKIINPTKVDTTVKFRLASAGDYGVAAEASKSAQNAKASKSDNNKGKGKVAANAGDAASQSLPLAFTIQPSIWEIPANEYRYVSIYFNPTEMRSYSARFLAEVDSQANLPESDRTLSFDVRGSGSLPSIMIEGESNPLERQDNGVLVLNFGRVMNPKQEERTIILRNESLMDATCVLEFASKSSPFELVSIEENVPFVIAAGQHLRVPIEFSADHTSISADDAELSFKKELKLIVQNNEYGVQTLLCQGVRYQCDASLRVLALPSLEDSFDEILADSIKLDFPELVLSETESSLSSSRSILLKNVSDTYMLRYDFTNIAKENRIKILPSIGHLAPHESIEVVATFVASQPSTIQGESISCKIQRIQYVGDDSNIRNIVNVWNNSRRTQRLATEEDLAIIAASEQAWNEYRSGVTTPTASKTQKTSATKKTGNQPIVPKSPPAVCNISLGHISASGEQFVYETLTEPANEILAGPNQEFILPINAVADNLRVISSDLQNDEAIVFPETYLYQSSTRTVTLSNDSQLHVPISWSVENQLQLAADIVPRRPSPNSSLSFTVHPSQATIAPYSSMTFTINYAPLDVNEHAYRLTATTSLQSPPLFRTAITGSSLLPLCHVDIQDSPFYLSQRPAHLKNEHGLLAPIESKTLRVIEVESIGIKTKTTVSFFVTNPTSQLYDYSFRALGEPCPSWHPLPSSSWTIPAGTRVQVSFEYSCEALETVEAFYLFRIPSTGFEQLLLFVGKVREPKVHFSTPKIDFAEVLLYTNPKQPVTRKQQFVVYIENDEDEEFAFGFDRSSLLQLDGALGPIIRIEPESGVVPARNQLALTMTFYPQEEMKYNYNLSCHVKRKFQKLSINVKGEGYLPHPQLLLQSSPIDGLAGGDDMTSLQPHPAMNYADFGIVQIHDTVTKKISLANNGRFGFDYHWDVSQLGPYLQLSETELHHGKLQKLDRQEFVLQFTPTKEIDYDLSASALFTLKCGRLHYNIMIRGKSVQPTIKFSFLSHDFGPSFITLPGASTVAEEVLLKLTNTGALNTLSVECLFQKTKALSMNCPPIVLGPGQQISIPITFTPREVKDYHFQLPFMINNTSKINIPITGRGITPRIELLHHAQHRVNFGSVNIGHEKSQVIEFINPTRKTLTVEFVDPSGKLEDLGITYRPTHSVIIPPKKMKALEVTFTPNERIKNFNEDIHISYAGITRKFVTFSGQSHGMSAELDTDALPFGYVVYGAKKMKKVKLSNTGDMPITYQWLTNSFGSHFTISPLQGRLAPSSEIFCEVIFQPTYVNEDIRQENVSVSIAGVGTLSLTCTGACAPLPIETSPTIDFSSTTRKAEVKNIKIANPSDRDWYLTPSLTSENWKVSSELKVPMKSSMDVPVTYYPLTMTASPQQPHTGDLFIPLPDGNALLYHLKGLARPPESSGHIHLDLAAKQASSTSMSISNWLPSTQCFDISVTVSEAPCPYPSGALTFLIPNKIELDGNVSKDFPLKMCCYCEGKVNAKIQFTNPSTGEYMFYTISAVINSSAIIDQVFLETPVRQLTRQLINIENPLGSEATIRMKDEKWWTCDCPDIRVRERSPIQGHREGVFEIEYRPSKYHAERITSSLTIFTHELGSFKYQLQLKVLASVSLPVLALQASLGSSASLPLTLLAFNSNKAEYRCQVEKYPQIFRLPDSLSVDGVNNWEGRETRIPITFEPDNIGSIIDKIIIKCSEGMEYEFEVQGQGTPPMPQGPINVPSNGIPVDIPIKNCFQEPATWTCIVDNPAFRLTSSVSLSLAAKAEGKCSLVFDPWTNNADAVVGQVITGTLYISCSSKPSIAPWTYYLRGVVEAPATAPTKAGDKKK